MPLVLPKVFSWLLKNVQKLEKHLSNFKRVFSKHFGAINVGSKKKLKLKFLKK